MDIVHYLSSNIPLFSVCAVMLFIAIRNMRIRRKESVLFIVFTAIVLALSFVVEVEKLSQRNGLVVLGTVFTSLGYVLRPILLYVFVLLANMDYKRGRLFYILNIAPLAANFVVYLLPLFFGVPGVSTAVFYYQANPDGTASFVRGGPLNFFSHAISLFFLGVLIYVSTLRFQGKHRKDGLVLVLCVGIIFVTVLTEVLVRRSDLLNIVCEICALINYVFIVSVNTSRDPLTNLYDRRTYYEDISRYHSLINGVVQIDMNELKWINDNEGHASGDAALYTIARILESSADNSSMCVYRLSGDEFLIMMFEGKEAQLEQTVASIRQQLNKTIYSAAVGAYFIDRPKDTTSVEDAMKEAERRMYIDKDNFYMSTDHKRRVGLH